MDKKYLCAKPEIDRAAVDRPRTRELSCVDGPTKRRNSKTARGGNSLEMAGCTFTEGLPQPPQERKAHSHSDAIAENIGSRRTQTKELVALYDLDGVRAALGMRPKPIVSYENEVFYDETPPDDTEHQARLGSILAQGDKGRWRYAVGPDEGFEDSLVKLSGRAPHLERTERSHSDEHARRQELGRSESF